MSGGAAFIILSRHHGHGGLLWDDGYRREVKRHVIIAYFRMDDGRVISAKEQEDYDRLMKNPRATYLDE